MRHLTKSARRVVAGLAMVAALLPAMLSVHPAQASTLMASDASVSTVKAGDSLTGSSWASKPTTSSSYYVRTADPAKLTADGAEAGRQATGTGDNLIVLMFGCPYTSGSAQGAETYDLQFTSIPQIETATQAFITGYLSSASPAAHLSVVVGTSNYGDNVTADHGKAWGWMMNDITGWVNDHSLSSRVSAYGGSDIEGGWGPPGPARAWVDGYHSATKVTFYNFGDTEGLPTTDGGAVHSPFGWTFDDYWYVTWGVGNTEALPQIYNTTFAKEWNQLVRYSLTKTGYPPMRIIGVLTMEQDARQTGFGATLSPSQAWKTLTDLLNSDPRTAQIPNFSTDIQKDWLP